MEEPIEIDADPLSGADALLQAGLTARMQVPEAILELIPSPTITVASLLERDLPTLLNRRTTGLRPAESCVTDVNARWTTGELLGSVIPSRTWLSDLEITLRKRGAAEAQATSIQHPRITNLYLPLWAVNFWISLADAAGQRAKWARAQQWLSERPNRGQMREAKGLMQRIPWGMTVWALTGASSASYVGILTKFLSTKWLRERQLDTLMSYLNIRAGEDGVGCWIADVYLSLRLKIVDRAKMGDDSDLNGYRDKIAASLCKHLLLPANLNNNHWIAFSVDLERNEFRYGEPLRIAASYVLTAAMADLGDSLDDGTDYADLQRIRLGLGAWMEVAFGVKVEDLGNTLRTGRQTDGHSCGVCTINAIEHAILGVPLFAPEDRLSLRVRYFVEAAGYLLRNVRMSFRTGERALFTSSPLVSAA